MSSTPERFLRLISRHLPFLTFVRGGCPGSPSVETWRSARRRGCALRRRNSSLTHRLLRCDTIRQPQPQHHARSAPVPVYVENALRERHGGRPRKSALRGKLG